MSRKTIKNRTYRGWAVEHHPERSDPSRRWEAGLPTVAGPVYASTLSRIRDRITAWEIFQSQSKPCPGSGVAHLLLWEPRDDYSGGVICSWCERGMEVVPGSVRPCNGKSQVSGVAPKHYAPDADR